MYLLCTERGWITIVLCHPALAIRLTLLIFTSQTTANLYFEYAFTDIVAALN